MISKSSFRLLILSGQMNYFTKNVPEGEYGLVSYERFI